MATHTICVHGLVFEVEGEYIPGDPGKYSGPPEHCYPAEPSEFLVSSMIYINDAGERFSIPWEVLDDLIHLSNRDNPLGLGISEEITVAALEAHEEWLHSLPNEPF